MIRKREHVGAASSAADSHKVVYEERRDYLDCRTRSRPRSAARTRRLYKLTPPMTGGAGARLADAVHSMLHSSVAKVSAWCYRDPGSWSRLSSAAALSGVVKGRRARRAHRVDGEAGDPSSTSARSAGANGECRHDGSARRVSAMLGGHVGGEQLDPRAAAARRLC